MKQFTFDLCLVLLFICAIELFFGNYQVSQTMFQRSINDFEEKVSMNENVSTQYTALQDPSDNQISSFLKD